MLVYIPPDRGKSRELTPSFLKELSRVEVEEQSEESERPGYIKPSDMGTIFATSLTDHKNLKYHPSPKYLLFLTLSLSVTSFSDTTIKTVEGSRKYLHTFTIRL